MKAVLRAMLVWLLVFALVRIWYAEYQLNHDETVHRALQTAVQADCVQYQAVQKEQEILPQYRTLSAENADFSAWVSIPDTPIDYPVMYTPQMPETYLRKDFYGADSVSGTPFIGQGCTLSPQSSNVIVYGHNMQNGSMFAKLLQYQSQDFCELHPKIYFDTLYEQQEYQVVYAFYVDLTTPTHFAFDAFLWLEHDEVFDAFVQQCAEHQLYDTGVSVSHGDTFLTLVTCSYQSKNGRFIVVAKQVS